MEALTNILNYCVCNVLQAIVVHHAIPPIQLLPPKIVNQPQTRFFHFSTDKILESLAAGTKTVTSQYLNTTAQYGSCKQRQAIPSRRSVT